MMIFIIYLFIDWLICLQVRRSVYIYKHEADVDLRLINSKWAKTRHQHRELRALLFTMSVWVL